jgi:hypothetical protein
MTEESTKKVRRWNRVRLALAVLAALLIAGRMIFYYFPHDHYYFLAQSLVHGRLDVDQVSSGFLDVVHWQGHNYLPFGPLPALLLVPFLPLLDLGLDLSLVILLLSALNVWLLRNVLRQLEVSAELLKWALLLFFGGTSYYSTLIMPFSTWLAHVTVITCLLLAITETLGKRRAWLIGLFVGLAGMSRVTALFALPFFVWLLWHGQGTQPGGEGGKSRLVKFAGLAAGIAGPLVLLLLYNYARFHNPLRTGYADVILTNPVLEQARAHGLFSLAHIPKNLFMLLLQGPVAYPSVEAPVLEMPYLQPTRWGMGIVFTSPALLLAFWAPARERLVQACWLAIACVLLPLITYYGVGWVQFGYRYALDFMPFLLVLAALGFKAVSIDKVRVLTTIAVLVNLWGATWVIVWNEPFCKPSPLLGKKVAIGESRPALRVELLQNRDAP